MSKSSAHRVMEELESHGKTFAVNLFRKQNESSEPMIGDQWWIQIPGLYRNGPEKNLNSQTIVDYYWSKIEAHTRDPEYRDALERYLLASLLPVYRSKRAVRVFRDSIPGKSDFDTSIATLGELIARSCEREICEADFSQEIIPYLRSDEIPSHCRPATSECHQLYKTFLAELLDKPLKMLRSGHFNSAVVAARSNWSSLRMRYSRRAGNLTEKIVLDMLAYEGKAAFHHAYSVLWLDLIPHLQEKYSWNVATEVFHKFWHLAPHLEDGGGQYTPFHGHIFGLHPGCGWMLKTDSGQKLIGRWLDDLRNVSAYRRVLHGLMVSIHFYVSRLSEQNGQRSTGWQSSLLKSTAEDIHGRPNGQRPRARRDNVDLDKISADDIFFSY